MTRQEELEKAGRHTSGNTPLHERRKALSNILDDATHMIRTMLANWPNEYGLPDDHNLHELLTVTDVVSKELATPEDIPDAEVED